VTRVPLAPALALSGLRLRLFRNYVGFQLIVDIGLPTGYALLTSRVLRPEFYDRLPVAAFLMASTLSLFRMPAILAMIEREFGTGSLLRTTGLSEADQVIASLVSLLYFAVFPALAYALTAVAMRTPPPAALGYWLPLAAYALTMHGLALLVGRPFRTFGPFSLTVNLVVVAAATLCPLFYPAERVPRLLWPIVAWLPPTLAAESASLARHGASAGATTLALIGWMVASLVAGYILAPWRRT
jgi:ABC-type polysaccharide/polyol phosphate export permease